MPITHPQLSTSTFGLSEFDANDDRENNDAQIAPLQEPTTVRVERPVPPIDFTLSRPISSLKELNQLTFRPAALNTRLTCRICRYRDGLDKLSPQYQLFLENVDTGEMQYVLTARKKRKTQTSYYTITGDYLDVSTSEVGVPKSVVLGKVRSNFLGTTFVIYSHGRNPFNSNGSEKNDLPVREELGAVLYDPNILGFKGPRKMTILTHTLTRDGKRPEFRPTEESETLLCKYRDGNARDLLILHNKSPQWNEDTQSFVLNFNGRVTQASVKNFQIVHDNDLDYIVMQFGRVERDYFTMDYKYPFCLLQAFAIALTSFDAKLACE
ncbi:tubby transcription factor, C-terminal [Phycomyces blakesleeanus NRRL 1555(-)]|uniref:Tubby transcription factor, C-terminal n=2 Tax=Phycomyces blakesleeanus TaxID=4837 RepID=A0A162XB69_PHYB8|nr:tubby transcription factor, C-terminal [Phycomyces blakesleeanus NRRL 1555(-)]OAD73645.1 tubby transcription factor, C-terminal [Phycomyces blakesleeanus NRRL 1555(-)]|eukprot:XP_018291685.1 tubby transcription factor, C-terminal [Phycomyces blakesleeanus NRRL 1555(-)]